MRKNGAFATERVDPDWTARVYERYMTFWASDYLVWRSGHGFELSQSRAAGVESWADDPACEAAADAWAKAMDG